MLLLGVMVGAVPAKAQSTGRIAGLLVARLTEAPIADATVVVVGQGISASSDSLGRFVLRDLRPGIVTLEVRRLGFRPVRRGDVVVSLAKPTEVTITMEPVDQRLEQVTVRPESFPALRPPATPVSTQVYDAEEVRRQPGAQEDVLRAVSVAPGVGVTSPSRNDLVVRGGAPFENLFVVDNLEVPNINHFGSQGSTGGPISLINIRFVESAAISTGGYGARYGDRAASVTDITLREGNRERIAGELNVAATQVGALLEGPIGSQVSFFANVRQSYLDLLFKAIGLSFIPSYTDATVKTVWRPNRRNIVSALAIGARGTVSFDNDTDSARVDNSQILAPVQDQYFSALTWKRLMSQGVVTTTLGRTWTRYTTAQRDSLLQPVFENRSTEGETSLRSDLSWKSARGFEVDAGTQVKYASALRYDATLAGMMRRDDNGVERPLTVDTMFSAWRQSAYAQGSAQLLPSLRVSLGVRQDWYAWLGDTFNDAVRVAPRASVAWQTGASTTLSLAAGRYWQPPSFIWLVGDVGNAQRLRPFRADHAVLGVSRVIGSDLKLQVEAYGKIYGDYPSRMYRPNAVLSPSGFDDVTTDIPFGLEPLESNGRGRVVGLEFSAQKKLGVSRWYGQSSVSLSRTRFAGLSRMYTVGAFDTPFTANTVLGWRPNARWELATRIRAASGLPYTPFYTSVPMIGTLNFSEYNSRRLPMFFSADLRIDRRFNTGRRQWVAFLDLQNVTNRENVGAPQWNPRLQRAELNTGVGLLPSIGLNFEF
ncbi:MAG: TonB-dependent receptor [Gemmatimonadaceae bacterium]|nr:TonB-dependent receptor [Gemmatimonadaceae bacterium]